MSAQRAPMRTDIASDIRYCSTPQSGISFINPWAVNGNRLPPRTHYNNCKHLCDKYGLSFYKVFNGNVIAVDGDTPLCECGTVDGAIRSLRYKGVISEAEN